MSRFILVVLTFVAVALTFDVQARTYGGRCLAAGFPSGYDRIILRSVRKHWPLAWQHAHCEWRAQLAAESSLSDKTCGKANRVGAKCLAQLLPGTAADVERATGLRGTRSSVYGAIMGGAWYMAKLGKFWSEPRPTSLCHREMAQASYIAGPGNIHKAQKVARAHGYTARCFDEIAPFLFHVIAAENARDTWTYVKRIDDLTRKMTDGR